MAVEMLVAVSVLKTKKYSCHPVLGLGGSSPQKTILIAYSK
jgi:hypothetical protein